MGAILLPMIGVSSQVIQTPAMQSHGDTSGIVVRHTATIDACTIAHSHAPFLTVWRSLLAYPFPVLKRFIPDDQIDDHLPPASAAEAVSTVCSSTGSGCSTTESSTGSVGRSNVAPSLVKQPILVRWILIPLMFFRIFPYRHTLVCKKKE